MERRGLHQPRHLTGDGNADADAPADPGTADNFGFILVVDQAYFDGLAPTIGTTKTVGSSSDRVDSALNVLLPTNSAPVAVADASDLGPAADADGGPAREAGAAVATADAIGSVLANDTDVDAYGETLTLLGLSGSAVVQFRTVNPGDSTLRSVGDSGFTSVAAGRPFDD